MGKIINGLKYGNKKTRSYIIIIILLLILGVVSVIAAIITKAPLWAMSAVFSFILACILIQSVRFQSTGRFAPEHKKEKKDKKSSETEERLYSKASKKEVKEDSVEENSVEDNFMESISENDVKVICKRYKVNKDHHPIIIDSCISEKIIQSPAYVWIERDGLKILVFEKEPRKITIANPTMTTITYERGAYANPEKDYQYFNKPSFLKLVFSSYLPTVYEERMGSGVYRKNLYVVGKDLKITNTSAKTMLRLLSLNLSVGNLIRDPRLQNVYFESAYALSIMLKDTVLSVGEYKVQIKDLLDKLTSAKISDEDFFEYMNQLVQARLITKEYAQYFLEHRK